MTTTISDDRSTNGSRRASLQAPGERSAPQRWRVRRGYAAAGVTVIVLAALLGAFVLADRGEKVEVLVAARDLQPGEVIDRSAVGSIEVPASLELSALPADKPGAWEGRVVASTVPAGAVLHRGHLLAAGDTFEAPDRVEVGLLLGPSRRPAGLAPGEIVQLVPVPAATSLGTEPDLPGPVEATVVSVGAEPLNAAGGVMVTVAVPVDAGAAVAQAGALDLLTVVVVGRGT